MVEQSSGGTYSVTDFSHIRYGGFEGMFGVQALAVNFPPPLGRENRPKSRGGIFGSFGSLTKAAEP